MQSQPTDRLWLDLDTTLRVLDQVYGQALESLEVNIVELYVLRALYEQDGQRPSDLARAIGRAQTAFTPILDKIEAKGFIERRANAHDRRSVQIHLTEAGKALQSVVSRSAIQMDTQVRSAIPDETWAVFSALLLALQQPVT